MSLLNQENRLLFPPANEDNGFRIALFIDNTMLAINRPGGGLIEAGEQAPRRPPGRPTSMVDGGLEFWKAVYLELHTMQLHTYLSFENS